MSKVKKILCLLLAVLMVLSMNIPVFANDNIKNISGNISNVSNDELFEITVSTDKSSYKTTNIATINVTVKNVSDESIENVKAQVVFDDLQPVSRRNSTTSKEVSVLQAGESFEFSYKATLNINKHNLNFFQKIFLWFVRLFNGGYTISSSEMDAIVENVTDIKFGKISADNITKINYEENNNTHNENNSKNRIQVLDTITDLTNSSDYKNLIDNNNKIECIQKTLNKLSDDGLIIKGSIKYSEYSNSFVYEYQDGTRGFVLVDPFDTMYTGNKISTKNEKSTTLDKSRSLISERTVTNSLNRTVFMYGLDKSDEAYSFYNKYDTLMKEYSKKGVIPTIYNNPSVEDYKTSFKNTDYICIIEHGVYDPFLDLFGFAVIGDVPNEKTENDYIFDTDNNLIISGTLDNRAVYIITPEFFEHYYKDNQLDNAVVFLFCCQGFGANGTIKYDFANAFHSCGASAVVGFHNTVWEEYTYPIYIEFTDNMLKGHSARESLDKAIARYGKNDIEYGTVFFPQSEYWEKINPKNGKTLKKELEERRVAAYPVLSELTFSVSGTVKVAFNNKSIENGSVLLRLIENDTTVVEYNCSTDKNGQFSMNVPAGTYNYTINKMYLFDELYETATGSITVVKGKENSLGTIYLTPKNGVVTATLSGSIKDETTGNAISGVRVEFIDNSTDNLTPVATTTTNENGLFSVNLPFGSYSLSFKHNSFEEYGMQLSIDCDNIVINDPILLNPKKVSSDTVEFNGNYYKIFDLSLSWEEAKAYCENLGGHLVTITSQEEQEIIKAYVMQNNEKEVYWIGGFLENGTWKWVTEESFLYSNWQPKEPNGSGNYLQLYNLYDITWNKDYGFWDDCPNEAAAHRGFICEWENISDITIENNNDTKTENTCITSCEIVDYGRYTENQGDSCVFHLDKSGLPGIDNTYCRNGNIGIDGTVYNNGLEVWIARWNFKSEKSFAYATYKLNGNYQKLSGKTGIINSYNTTNFDTTVYFYNGDTLLQKVDLTNSDYAKNFSVDVSDVKELKILVKDNNAVAGGTSFALYDMFLT